MFPLKDANPRHAAPVIMWLLVIINALVFYHEFSLFGKDLELERFVTNFGFIPEEFFAFPIAEAPTLITSLFLHGSLLHIIGNMFFLIVFGDNVEDRMGHSRFLFFYLLGGTVATLVHGLFSQDSNLPLVGASGAVSAVLGAYIVLFPRQKVLTIIPPLLFPWLLLRLFGRTRRFFAPWLPAWIYIGYWALLQFFEAGNGLLNQDANMSNIAFLAHVGGFVFGVLTVRLFLKAKPETQLPGSISP